MPNPNRQTNEREPTQEQIGDQPADPAFQPGEQFRFDYPADFTTLPEYTAYAGQTVTIVRPMRDQREEDDEYENLGDPLYVIRAEDGWEGQAWESELICLEFRSWKVWLTDTITFARKVEVSVPAKSRAEAHETVLERADEFMSNDGVEEIQIDNTPYDVSATEPEFDEA